MTIPPTLIFNGRRYVTNPAYTAYLAEQQAIKKREQAAKAIAEAQKEGFKITETVLSRTASNVLRGKSAPSSDRYVVHQVGIAQAKESLLAGNLSIQEYQKRITSLDAALNEANNTFTIETAARAKRGLDNAAKAERERFAQIGVTDFAAQERANAVQLQKVSNTLTNAGFDPADLQRAQGKPNVNSALKITTPEEKRQSEFARTQVSKSVESVSPSYGDVLYDSRGSIIAKNVKQSGGFSFSPVGKAPTLNQVVIASSGAVLGSITGKSPGTQFSVFETRRNARPVQGPVKPMELPQFVKTSFYTFDDFIGPRDERVKGPVGGLENTYGSNETFLSKTLNRLSERSDKLLDTNRDPLSQVIIPFAGFGIAVGNSLYNLAGYAGPAVDKFLFGKNTDRIEVKVPKTVGGDYLSAQIEGTTKAITTGNKGELYKGNEQANKKLQDFYEKYGPISFASSVAAETIGVPLRSLSPLKITEAVIPAAKGAERIGTTLKIGYGKLSTPIVSRIGGKFGLGYGKDLLTKRIVEPLFPSGALEAQTGRGLTSFEIATSQKLTQELLTSPKGLQSLVEAGKILPSDVTFIKAQKKLAELAGLAQKEIPTKELVQTETLPRGIFEGLETVAEEETLIEKIVPQTRPVKGSQIFFTQLRKGLQPLGLFKSDIDVDYIGGLLGDRYATNRATEITRKTVESLNDIMSQQRAAVASGTKVFTGKIIEGVVFKPTKITRKQLQGGGEKLAEFLTKKDTDGGTNSIINDVSKIFNVKKSRNIVKVKTGYSGLFGPKVRKEVPLPTQLLNQIASATRIQSKLTEVEFRGTEIPFLKKGYTQPIYTQSGFRVGSDLQRFKDIARQQPVALQLAELLEGKGYTGKIAEVRSIFEDIKKAKPEIDFDAAFKDIEKIAESEKIQSPLSYITQSSSSGAKQITPVIKLYREQESPKQTSKVEEKTSIINLEELDSIASIPKSRVSNLSRTSSIRSSVKNSIVSKSSNIKLPRYSIPSIYPPSPRSTTSPRSIFSPISPTSPNSPFSPISPSPASPTKITGKSIPPIKLDLPKQPIEPKTPKIIGLSLQFKLNQVKRIRLPSQSKRKFYIAGPADPLRAGVFAPKGVKTLRSSNPNIFKQIDINLIKARKNKKAYDPLNSFKIAKSGKYVYSSKNLLNSYAKIKI